MVKKDVFEKKNNCYLSVYGVFRSEFNRANLTSLLTAETSPFCVSCINAKKRRKNTEEEDANPAGIHRHKF